MNAALLAFLANPEHALLLLLAGILFIYAEFNRPGTIVPGCIGALSILFAMYGLLHLEVRRSGFGEIAFGLAILAAGIRFPLRGAIPGVACAVLAFGLTRVVIPPVSPIVALGSSAVFCSVTYWLARVAVRARLNKTIYTRFEPYPSIPPVQRSVPPAR
jgi:membrane-bound serine protease (ClpP class)